VVATEGKTALLEEKYDEVLSQFSWSREET